jgi:hypothetical protein
VIILLWIGLLLASIIAFWILQVLPLREAERSGELDMRMPLTWKVVTVRRVDDPTQFEIEIRKIRARWWAAGCIGAFAVLLIGLTL